MLDTFPDISELLVTAPIAIILLIFIGFVFKLLIKLITELVKLSNSQNQIIEKQIELIRDIKKIELN